MNVPSGLREMLGSMLDQVRDKDGLCQCGRAECLLSRAFHEGVAFDVRGTAVSKDLTAGKYYTVSGVIDADVKVDPPQPERFAVADDDGVRFVGGVTLGEYDDPKTTTPFTVSELELASIKRKLIEKIKPGVEAEAEARKPKMTLGEAFQNFVMNDFQVWGVGQVLKLRKGHSSSRSPVKYKHLVVVTESLLPAESHPESGECQDIIVMFIDSDGEIMFSKENSVRFERAPEENQLTLEGK